VCDFDTLQSKLLYYNIKLSCTYLRPFFTTGERVVQDFSPDQLLPKTLKKLSINPQKKPLKNSNNIAALCLKLKQRVILLPKKMF
jgi:hypothetical protein